MRLAILTPRRKESILLVNHLVRNGFKPDLLIFHRPDRASPKGPFSFQSMKTTVKRRLFFFLESERIRRIRASNHEEAGRLIGRFAKEKGLSMVSTKGIARQMEVADVNGEQVIRALKDAGTDILFIWGIPVVKEQVLNAVESVTINAHSSILPEYRGSRSEFWQFHNRDFSNCGITLHRVDTGVDTGAVLMQVHANSSELVNPEVLHAWNVIRVVESLPVLLGRLRDGVAMPVEQSALGKPRTKTYRMRDVRSENLRKVYLGGR